MNAPSPSSAPLPAAAKFPAARVTPNAAHAFGGIWRLTVRRFFSVGHWLAMAGMLAALAVFAIGLGHPGRATGHFVEWAARFYVCFLVPVLAFISGASAMRDDLKADAVDYVFTRPVRRPAFVLFRYLAHVACTQLDFLLALGVVIIVGVPFNSPGLWSAVPLLLLAQVVMIVAFSAFGFLCGMLTSRYMIVGLLYGGIVEAGLGNIPTQLNRFSMIRQVLGLLRPIVGDENGALVTTLGAPATIGLLLVFTAAMLAATAAVFATRELDGASGKDA